MLFRDGIFTPDEFGDERAAEVLRAAANRGATDVRPSDIVHTAITGRDAAVLDALATTMDQDVRPQDVTDLIDVFNPTGPSGVFDGRRERFSAELLSAFEEFEGGDGQGESMALERLLACVLSHLDREEQEALDGILDALGTADILRARASVEKEPLEPLVDAESGRLREAAFSEGAWTCLQRATVHAAELGYDQLLPLHCYLSLLEEPSGLAEQLLRLQAPIGYGPAKVAEIIAATFRRGDSRTRGPDLPRDHFGAALMPMLHRAQKAAYLRGADRVDTPYLLLSLLDTPPAPLASLLRGDPLRLDLGLMRERLSDRLRQTTSPTGEQRLLLPEGLLPCEDLTWLARTGGITPALHLDGYLDAATRALHRSTNRNVVVTGLPGTGTTTLVRELARRAAAGEAPGLTRKRFLWVDCRDVTAAASGDKLTRIIGHVSGRPDVVLCLDGLGPILRGERGTDHRPALRGALKERRVHLLGVMTGHDYADLLAADHELAQLITRVDVTEPDQATSQEIVGRAAEDLAGEHGLTITPRAVELAVRLSVRFIFSEHLPLKAIKVLRQACEDLAFERARSHGARDTVDGDDIARVVSERSGVPIGSGAGAEKVDYVASLGKSVVGQPQAVAEVAAELRQIRADTAPRTPASVMFFAGLTGVGKTELAKAIAKLYSTSKRPRFYSMGNFTLHHSVTGITGVPAGYVGHERGGPLINDLNADPHAVFLLDEAEKAHPDIWRPFLTLFDEGWIEDQRGVRARGDHAIFILTSNAGRELIQEMTKEKRPAEEIAVAVRHELAKHRHSRSNELVFPPELLARVRRVIVFRPLDQQAMEGICGNVIEQRRRTYAEKDKELVVPSALVRHIAKIGHAENRASGDTAGGRIVEKKVAELIDDTVLRAADAAPDAYAACRRIELAFSPPEVTVTFRTDRVPDRRRQAEEAAATIRAALQLDAGTLTVGAIERINRIRMLDPPDALQGPLRVAQEQLVEHARESDETARGIVAALLATISVSGGDAS